MSFFQETSAQGRQISHYRISHFPALILLAPNAVKVPDKEREGEEKKKVKHNVVNIQAIAHITHAHKQSQRGHEQEPDGAYAKGVHDLAEIASDFGVPSRVVFVHDAKFTSLLVHEFTS